MKARLLTTASLIGAFAQTLPAVDPQLLKLVMPDVKLMSDVNVAQARLSPFGQYVLTQLPTAQIQKLVGATGFDPRQDLTEILLVSSGSGTAVSSLALASGSFSAAMMTASSVLPGATQETYKGINIVGNSTKTEGIAFLNGSAMIAGSFSNVKAAIDRQTAPVSLPPSVVTQANQLSVSYDAWAFSTVSPAALTGSAATASGATASSGRLPAMGGMKIPANALTQVQAGYVAVKFGSNVTFAAQAQTDTDENAAGLAGFVQLAGNLAQMQSAQNPDAAAVAKSLTVSQKGNVVNISASIPESQFQQFLAPKVKAHLQAPVK